MGNLILNDIIYYNICGENINLDIVKAIFPQKLNENERCYSFNNPKVRWVSKIYSSGFSDGNIQSICHNIKERKSVILIFGENDAENLCKKLDKMDEVYMPLVVFLTKTKIQNIKMSDNRRIRNIIYNDDFSKTVNEIMSELWKIEAYYNERGNEYDNYFPSNIKGEKDIRSDTSFNILLTGFSRAGKSTFINLISKKLIAYESPQGVSTTQKLTNYYITLDNTIQNMAKIKIIDTPGLIIEEDSKKNNQKNIIKLIKESLKQSLEQKDKINMILFFIRGEAFNFNCGVKKVFEYLNTLKIKLIFVLNGATKKKGKNFSSAYGAIRQYLEDNKFKELLKEKIIEVNLVETEHRKIEGISKLFLEMCNYFIERNKLLFNDELNNEIINLTNKLEEVKIKKDKNELKEIKGKIDKIYKQLKKNELFEGFDNYNDIIKYGYIKSSLKSTAFSLFSLASGWIPLPLADIPVVLGLQAWAIISIGESYGFNIHEINFFKCLQYCFGSSIGEFAQVGTKGAALIGKNILKEGAEEGAKQLIKTSSKSALKPINYLIELLAKSAAKSEAGEGLKTVPIIGTIIGGILSSVINITTTSTLCYKCQKYYEQEIIDNFGLNFIRNRIEIFTNLFMKLSQFEDKEYNEIEYIICKEPNAKIEEIADLIK